MVLMKFLSTKGHSYRTPNVYNVNDCENYQDANYFTHMITERSRDDFRIDIVENTKDIFKQKGFINDDFVLGGVRLR